VAQRQIKYYRKMLNNYTYKKFTPWSPLTKKMWEQWVA
jgi:hypothetical protein